MVASTAIWKVRSKYHTPICGNSCNLTHHELVLALFMDGRCANARIPRSGDLPFALKQRIESAKLSGWDQNSDIPDPLEELRCPLLFLACAFGKTGIVKALLQNNFDPRVVNQHGETALHHTAQHLWSHYAKPGRAGAKGTTAKASESFEKIVKQLTDCDPKILAMKDDSGRTALHVLAVNILKTVTRGPSFYINFSRAAHFHQLCLKSIIGRLLKLLDASIFTRREVLEIISTAESTYGDSVLHILARDSAYGFEVLKFLQDWLFAGQLPEEKNSENKTALELARETDPQGAKIKLSPWNSLEHQAQQGIPLTQSIQSEKALISNSGVVDIMEPAQTSHSSNLEGSLDFGTGNPFPQCTFPVIENEGDLPYITQVFSLCGNESSASGRGVDSSSKLESLTMPSNVEIVESCGSAGPGSNNMNTDNSFGLNALALVRQNAVGLALTQYSDKLSELEESLPKLDQIIREAEAVLCQKIARVNILKKELDLEKRGALAKMKSIEELNWKKELLREETKRLKRKVDFCQEKQNQLVILCKKGRLS
ncbi:hypothetical protein ACROYT_G010425 [Oculina patagonica]